jgi:hypothetical protein
MELFKLAQSMLSEESKQNLTDAMFNEFQTVFKSHGWQLSKIEKKTTSKKVTTAPKKKAKKAKGKVSLKKPLTVGGQQFGSIKEFAVHCGVNPTAIYAAKSAGKDLSKYLPGN